MALAHEQRRNRLMKSAGPAMCIAPPNALPVLRCRLGEGLQLVGIKEGAQMSEVAHGQSVPRATSGRESGPLYDARNPPCEA